MKSLMWLAWISLPVIIIVVLGWALADRGFTRLLPGKIGRTAIVRALLSLEPEQLAELFRLYRQQFGPGAAKYARRTYEKWKAGDVNPNRRTFNRLAIHLPTVMSFDLKCELLRALKHELCARDDHEFTVYTDDWKGSLRPLVSNIIAKSHSAALPASVVKQLTWLSRNDMTVADAMLSEAQARESSQAVSLLHEEIAAIDKLLAETNGHGKVVHVINLPYGDLTLHIKRRKSDG